MAKSRSVKASFKDYLNLKSQLSSKNSSLIGIYGSSECLVESAVDAVRARAKNQSMELTILEGSTINESVFDSITNQTSLFEASTLYVVRRAEQAKSLGKLLKALSPDRISKNWSHRLVLVWSGVDPTAAVMSEMKRLSAFIMPCMEPWPNEVPQVIQMYASSVGLNLAPDAIQLMIEANGSDFIKHRHELNKISLIKHAETATIKKEDLAPFIGLLREDDAFLLDRLLLQGQWSEAMALLEGLLDRGEKALGILSILATHCRNILKIQGASSQGHQLNSLSEETRLPTFILKNYLPMAARADAKRYVQALEICQQTDIALKSNPIAESLLVSQVIEVLARPE